MIEKAKALLKYLIYNSNPKIMLEMNSLDPLAANALSQIHNDQKCSICTGNFIDSQNICLTTCNHAYHEQCIDHYFN